MTQPKVPGRQTAMRTAGTTLLADDTETALKQAGLFGWNVRQEEMWTPSGLLVPNQFALVRDNPQTAQPEVMATCGNRYKITSNEEHAGFLDAMLEESHGRYDSAAPYKGGNVVMLSIKVPETMTIAGEDPIDLYFTAINSFNGKMPFTVVVDPVRAFCANQLNYFRSRKVGNSFKIRHTSHIGGKVQLAREALEVGWKVVEELAKEADFLINKPMTFGKYTKLVEEIFPRPEKNQSKRYEQTREELAALWNGPTNANITGTAWGGFNAVTEWMQFYKPTTDQSMSEDVKRAERAMTNPTEIAEKDRIFKMFARA